MRVPARFRDLANEIIFKNKKNSLSKKVELAGAKIEGRLFFEQSSWGDLKIPKHNTDGFGAIREGTVH